MHQKKTAIFKLDSPSRLTFSARWFPKEKLELKLKTHKKEFNLRIDENDQILDGYFGDISEVFDCFLDQNGLKTKRRWFKSK